MTPPLAPIPTACSAPRCVPTTARFKADAAASLRDRLPPCWRVERIVEPAGEVAVVVLPADDDPAMPVFLLHDRAGAPHVATIEDDSWVSDRGFAGWHEAESALAALAAEAVRTPLRTCAARAAA